MSRRPMIEVVGRLERSDVALAVLLLVPSLAQVLLEPIAPRVVGVVVALGSVAPIAWRRIRPSAAALIGTVVWLIPTDGFLYLGYVVAVILFFSVGAYASSVLRIVLVTLWGATVGTISTLAGPEPNVAVFGTLLVVVAPVVAGRLMAHQRAQTVRLQELTAQLVDERARAERTAVAEERTRIARELHDVVGHDVTVIALQAEAAAAAIDAAPELARAPLDVIRVSASSALQEMRRVLGGLRISDPDDTLHPQPVVADIPALVKRSVGTGAAVDLSMTGIKSTESASVELAVYRIVQESLTNARRHAPGAAVRIEVAWSSSGVDVTVTNPARPPARDVVPGFGLVGMHERVRLLGGRLRTGRERGEFRVEAYLPYEVEEP